MLLIQNAQDSEPTGKILYVTKQFKGLKWISEYCKRGDFHWREYSVKNVCMTFHVGLVSRQYFFLNKVIWVIFLWRDFSQRLQFYKNYTKKQITPLHIYTGSTQDSE